MASIQSLTEDKGKQIQDNKGLSESLADGTKIKISLVNFICETRHNQEATEQQVAWEQYRDIADTINALSNSYILWLPLLWVIFKRKVFVNTSDNKFLVNISRVQFS